MNSPFDALDHLVSSAVVDAFAEVAVIRPRSSSQYAARRADADRDASQVRGIFSAGPSDQRIRGQAIGGESSGTTRIDSMSAEFWISRDDMAALGVIISKGDAISFPARCGQPVYSVATIQRTNQGDVALILVIEDQSP